jgi:hypothetical protein
MPELTLLPLNTIRNMEQRTQYGSAHITISKKELQSLIKGALKGPFFLSVFRVCSSSKKRGAGGRAGVLTFPPHLFVCICFR